jgi:hypothetical protein
VWIYSVKYLVEKDKKFFLYIFTRVNTGDLDAKYDAHERTRRAMCLAEEPRCLTGCATGVPTLASQSIAGS